MRIDVVSSVNEAHSEDFVNKTVLVIDVLRSTSNMAAALMNGCRAILPAETIQNAKKLQKPGDLLGGERNCRKIPGFDLGNSPFDYTESIVRGKRVVMTTTNGTRALQKAAKAQYILACSLLNGPSCCRAAIGYQRDIVILCAGTRDEFSLEDGLCAGKLVTELKSSKPDAEVGDFGTAMEFFAGGVKDTAGLLLGSSNGKRLCRLGYREDVLFCADWNRYDIVPVMNGGQLVPLIPSMS
jgi:2-phosphosulfolactate phosphatase